MTDKELIEDLKGSQREYCCHACRNMSNAIYALAQDLDDLAAILPADPDAHAAVTHTSGILERGARDLWDIVRECTRCGKYFLGRPPVVQCGDPAPVELCPDCRAREEAGSHDGA